METIKPYKACHVHDKESCLTCPSRINGIFSDLAEKHLQQLDLHKSNHHYKKGQTIFYEESDCPGVFCLVSGQVKLVKNGAEGKETLYKIISPGEAIGVYDIISKQSSNVTAVAMQDTEVCFVDKKFIIGLIKNDSDLALKVIQKMTQDLHDFENRLNDIQNKDVQQRIAKLLFVLSSTHGTETEQGLFLDIKLTRSDMAAMVSTTPESVMRTLSEFKNFGHIDLISKKIYLKKIEEIRQIAEV
ncbi:MAG TPA: Crp/Fnr family transcriptional regulator [Oligoflexia bacterium]|nr:Crp/Fnr family transcriptional regulator [Oligoflexia bacterium]HMR24251.1 Crp/Fnr family transcriptional regulator [Oligoflexia bacterium]